MAKTATVSFSKVSGEVMEHFAKERNTTLENIVAEALSNYAQLAEDLQNGGKLYIESPEGIKREIIVTGIQGPQPVERKSFWQRLFRR